MCICMLMYVHARHAYSNKSLAFFILSFPLSLKPSSLHPFIPLSLYRGPASEWYDAIQPFLLYSAKIRRWFVDTVFLQHRGRFSEYLLECPSAEVSHGLVKCSFWSHLLIFMVSWFMLWLFNNSIYRFVMYFQSLLHSSAGWQTKTSHLKWKSPQMLELVCTLTKELCYFIFWKFVS